MRASDYGPVVLSRLKSEQSHIFDALETGRRVLVAHKGEVVAAIDPTPALPRQVLAMYAMPQIDTSPYELTATVMNQERPPPSHWLKRAKSGQPSLVTRSGKLFGALRSITPAELAAEQVTSGEVARRDAAVDRFLEENPDATADQLADFTSELDNSTPAPNGHVPYLHELLGDCARTVGRRTAAIDALYRFTFAESDDLVESDLREMVEQRAVS